MKSRLLIILTKQERTKDMRTLSAKQKQLLREHADTVPEDGIVFYSIEQDDTMTFDKMEKIESLNPHETFIQNADRYVSDYKTSKHMEAKEW